MLTNHQQCTNSPKYAIRYFSYPQKIHTAQGHVLRIERTTENRFTLLAVLVIPVVSYSEVYERVETHIFGTFTEVGDSDGSYKVVDIHFPIFTGRLQLGRALHPKGIVCPARVETPGRDYISGKM